MTAGLRNQLIFPLRPSPTAAGSSVLVATRCFDGWWLLENLRFRAPWASAGRGTRVEQLPGSRPLRFGHDGVREGRVGNLSGEWVDLAPRAAWMQAERHCYWGGSISSFRSFMR